MPYEPEQFYEGQILSAEVTELANTPCIDCYVKSEHGGIKGLFWMNEKSFQKNINAWRSYGLSDDEILGLEDDASPLVGKTSKFKTRERTYVNRQGESKTMMQIAFFVSLREKAQPPSTSAKARMRELLIAGLQGAEAPPIMAATDEPELIPISEDEAPF